MGRQRAAKNKSFPPHLYQNAAGYFYFVNPRSRKARGLGKDRAKAFAEARAANATLAAMQPSSLADWVSGKQDYTLAQWLPLYEALWADKQVRSKNTLRAAASYLSRLSKSDLGWRKLSEIQTVHAATYLREFEKESGSPAALAMRSRMRDVFRVAETQGLITQGSNPVAATDAPSRVVKRERLSLEQFHLVREHAPVWLQRAMLLALVTGQRREDIANMKFADIKDGYLFVTLGKSQGRTKLQIDLNIKLEAVGVSIAEAIAQCRDLIVSRHLVHHVAHRSKMKPGARVSPNGISNAFQEAVIAAGIVAAAGRTPPSFHEIRSLAQRLFREEMGAEFAQAMLGHKSAQMTAKYDDLRGSGYKVITKK